MAVIHLNIIYLKMIIQMNGINISILSQYIKCIKLFNNFNIKHKMSIS